MGDVGSWQHRGHTLRYAYHLVELWMLFVTLKCRSKSETRYMIQGEFAAHFVAFDSWGSLCVA